MTSSLPQDVREVFDRFITTEYATVDARQQPIVWPVTPYYQHGDATIDVTTGVGYPKKALDARAQPAGRPAVLRSHRLRDRERHPRPGPGHRRGRRPRPRRQPRALRARGRARSCPSPRTRSRRSSLAGLFSWYSERIYVKVRPERVFVWPDGEAARARAARLPRRGGALRPRRGAARAARRAGRRRRRLGRAHRGARPPLPDARCSPGSRPTAFRSPPGCRSPATAPRAAVRIELGPAGPAAARRAAPASPPTPTPPTSAGRRTSRSAATWPATRTAAGALVPTSWSAASSSRRRAGSPRCGATSATPAASARRRKRMLAAARPLDARGNGSSPACQGPAG